MSDPINSASRILQLLEKTPKTPVNTIALDVWAEVFSIEEGKQATRAHKVSNCLYLTNIEISVIRKQLAQTNFPEKIYLPPVSNLEEAFSAFLLPHGWANTIQYLTDNTITALTYWAAILPNEENLIGGDELEELSKLLSELEVLTMESKLPISLLDLINHQIELIRKAIQNYPISGAKGLRSAAISVYGELLIFKEEINSHPSEETSKFRVIWDKLLKTIDNAETIDKGISLSLKAIEFFNKIT